MIFDGGKSCPTIPTFIFSEGWGMEGTSELGSGGGLLPTSVGTVLERALERDPAREALVCADARMTYEELDRAAERAASALAEMGVEKDDVVAVSLANTSDVVITFHAVARLGAIWLGVNRNLAPPEKQFILDDASARLLLASPDVAEGFASALDGFATPPVLVVGDDASAWRELVRSVQPSYRRPNRRATDPAGIAYTSGTTGRPKGVVHSHVNLLLPGAMLINARGFGPDLRKGDCAALTILNMQVTSTLLVAQAGGTQVVMDRVDPFGVAAWIRNEAVNSWFGVPTILQGLVAADEVAVEDLRSLTDTWTGGTYLPESIRAAFESRFSCRVSATYGLTEAPTVVTIENRDEPRLPGCSGMPLPHLVVEIRDGATVQPSGEAGEITVRAQQSGVWAELYRPMLGYLGNPEATAETVRGGVLYTGDIGHLDARGRLFVQDRRNALILRGGANVYPAEIERVILEVQGVRGVAVVGVPDERLGQRVAAAIEVDEGYTLGIETLANHCTSQLARYKVPDLWRIAALPRNAMGKVVRTEIETWFDAPDDNAL
jgi:acyl-CoA synthetase (AMP-forming)/AMP-acid ligase II